MKKILFLIPVLTLVYACAGETKPTEQTAEEAQQKIEAVELSTQKVEKSINASEVEMEKTQSDIDSLLNNI
jgi:peptidoglycan hydrolase CwlO-like protein